MRLLRYLGLFVGAFVATLAVALLWPGSPAYLPRTSCRVDQQRYDALAFGVGIAQASRQLGCEGVLLGEERLGDLAILTFAWRADGTPIGILRARFYNDTLQEKSLAKLDLSFALPWRRPQAEAKPPVTVPATSPAPVPGAAPVLTPVPPPIPPQDLPPAAPVRP